MTAIFQKSQKSRMLLSFVNRWPIWHLTTLGDPDLIQVAQNKTSQMVPQTLPISISRMANCVARRSDQVATV